MVILNHKACAELEKHARYLLPENIAQRLIETKLAFLE